MNSPQVRVIESFPEPKFTALRNAAFADFGERSALLADVLADEAIRRIEVSVLEEQIPQQLRIGAFINNQLVAWSYARGEDNQLHMVNSGVSPDLRRQGIYSRLVAETIAYADLRGFTKIISRHAQVTTP
jgi:ribosomal protein S18 acetylase RimI-like enzyme